MFLRLASIVVLSMLIFSGCASGPSGGGAQSSQQSNLCVGKEFWKFRAHSTIINKAGELQFNPRSTMPHNDCKQYFNKVKEQKDFLALNENGELLIEKDMCSEMPTLLFGPWGRTVLEKKLYVRFYTDPGHPNINTVERDLVHVTGIIARQCGSIPDRIRVKAGKDFSRSGIVPAKLNRRNLPPFTYRETYSGTFYPKASAFHLEHDDQRRAELVLASVERDRDEARRLSKWAEGSSERAAYGAGLIAAFLYAATSSGGSSAFDIGQFCSQYPLDKKPLLCLSQ